MALPGRRSSHRDVSERCGAPRQLNRTASLCSVSSQVRPSSFETQASQTWPVSVMELKFQRMGRSSVCDPS